MQSLPNQPLFSERPWPMFGLLRLSLAWIFLWAAIDKIWGLGFATEPGKAWVDGVSPTLGFLKFGTSGPLAEFYQSIAGQPIVDWLYMLGLGGIGLALLFGFALRIAGWAGALMMLLIWSAALPPEHNPFLDEHIVYILILVGIALRPTLFAWLSLHPGWMRLTKNQGWLE